MIGNCKSFGHVECDAILMDKANIVAELKSISCAVFENPAEADIWIKRKHSGELNGVGTVTWNAQPTYNSIALDYCKFSSTVGACYSFDITKIFYCKCVYLFYVITSEYGCFLYLTFQQFLSLVSNLQ